MKYLKLLIWLTVFAVSMALLESAVVIYIRELLYPEGFQFPLMTLESRLAITEILREIATILMLMAVGILSGRTFAERFAIFIYSFAIWDIFYYIFLYLLIGWPENIMVWDVLFLIPVTWTGPVLSPLIVCLLMISLSIVIMTYSRRGVRLVIGISYWVMLLTGSLVLILAFTWDYSRYILDQYTIRDLLNLPGRDDLFDLATSYIPVSFNWFLFSLGAIIIVIPIIALWVRMDGSKFTEKNQPQSGTE